MQPQSVPVYVPDSVWMAHGAASPDRLNVLAVDQRGKPLVSTEIRALSVEKWSGTYMSLSHGSATATTNAEGFATFPDMKRGEYALSAPGSRAVIVRVPATGLAVATFPGTVWRFYVRDNLGRPSAGAVVGVRWREDPDLLRPDEQLVCDDDGVVSARLPPDIDFAVRALSSDGEEVSEVQEVAASSTATSMALEVAKPVAGGSLRLAVDCSQNQIAQPFRADIIDAASGLLMRRIVRRLGEPSPVVDGLPPGDYRVKLASPPSGSLYSELFGPVPSPTVQIRAGESHDVRIAVICGGDVELICRSNKLGPAERVTLVFTLVERDVVHRVRPTIGLPLGSRRMFVVDPNVTVRHGPLQAGRMLVSIDAPGYVGRSVDCHITPGEVTPLDIDLDAP
ncbi:MAG: hypothetical protein GC161_06060 [Planctomycetaceae bacterium]|nr:hypothetical protein [Planctomycetaceae bacterium]